ncbi:unnamed protein product [Closterium sp. Naga37s-1]|nr:unnamed protein product [Closterium sp. Naga37s-1]
MSESGGGRIESKHSNGSFFGKESQGAIAESSANGWTAAAHAAAEAPEVEWKDKDSKTSRLPAGVARGAGEARLEDLDSDGSRARHAAHGEVGSGAEWLGNVEGVVSAAEVNAMDGAGFEDASTLTLEANAWEGGALGGTEEKQPWAAEGEFDDSMELELPGDGDGEGDGEAEGSHMDAAGAGGEFGGGEEGARWGAAGSFAGIAARVMEVEWEDVARKAVRRAVLLFVIARHFVAFMLASVAALPGQLRRAWWPHDAPAGAPAGGASGARGSGALGGSGGGDSMAAAAATAAAAELAREAPSHSENVLTGVGGGERSGQETLNGTARGRAVGAAAKAAAAAAGRGAGGGGGESEADKVFAAAEAEGKSPQQLFSNEARVGKVMPGGGERSTSAGGEAEDSSKEGGKGSAGMGADADAPAGASADGAADAAEAAAAAAAAAGERRRARGKGRPKRAGAGAGAGAAGRVEEDDPWDVVKRFWSQPAVVKLRMSITMANLTMGLPTFLAHVLPSLRHVRWHMVPLLHDLSLPMLAPILFGSGIVFKSVVNNLGIVLPRLGIAVVLLWVLWGCNCVLQRAITKTAERRLVDRNVKDVLVLAVEITMTAAAVVTVLSSVGIRISALVLPLFIVTALAGKDLWHNYFGGFFLFAARPFRAGDTLALHCSLSPSAPSTPAAHVPVGTGWFEGVCESVDLRFTVVRSGTLRLFVPNARFAPSFSRRKATPSAESITVSTSDAGGAVAAPFPQMHPAEAAAAAAPQACVVTGAVEMQGVMVATAAAAVWVVVMAL